MAKKKPKAATPTPPVQAPAPEGMSSPPPEIAQAVLGDLPAIGPQPEVPEDPEDVEPIDLQQLLAENARLKAELANREPSPAMPAEPTGPRKFRVELQHAPSWIVEAIDAANAWDAYKAAAGVIASDYTPE